MKVTLVQFGSEEVCGKAARVCTEPGAVEDIFKQISPEKDLGVLKRCLDMGHDSVIEHMYFTFLVSGVSRAFSHQLVRHRIASYSQRSQRYITEGAFGYVTPPSIANRKAWEDKGLLAPATVYAEHMRLVQTTYDALIAAGVPAEDARFVLPNACETQLVVSKNARSVLHFLEERLCGTAQWEAQFMAKEMAKLFKEAAPILASRVGPKCHRDGVCKQAKSRWELCKRAPHKSMVMHVPTGFTAQALSERFAAVHKQSLPVSTKFTCDNCFGACGLRWDAYNTNGFCLAYK